MHIFIPLFLCFEEGATVLLYQWQIHRGRIILREKQVFLDMIELTDLLPSQRIISTAQMGVFVDKMGKVAFTDGRTERLPETGQIMAVEGHERQKQIFLDSAELIRHI